MAANAVHTPIVVREGIDDLPRFITVDELARRIGRHRFTIYHWVKDQPHRLPRVTRVHGRVFFIDSDVRAWFEAVRAGSVDRDPSSAEAKPRRGRPTKAEQIRQREASR